MTTFIVIIHVLVCVALILIVLLQTGKGADMGAAFGGGGSQTLFGATGASTFLGKATTVAAVIFMLTSLTLAYMSTSYEKGSIMDDAPVTTTSSANEQADGKPEATQPSADSADTATVTDQAEPMEDNAAQQSAASEQPGTVDDKDSQKPTEATSSDDVAPPQTDN